MALFDSLFHGWQRSRTDLAGLDPGDASSLALLDAMGGIERAGYERSASPAGAIAKNLIPLFGAIIQSRAMERQAQLQDLMLRMKMGQLAGDPEKRAAELEKTRAETELTRARTTAVSQPRSPSLTDNQILLGKLSGDPVATALWNEKQQAKQQQAEFASGLIAQRSEDLRQRVDAVKEQERLQSAASHAPEYRNKTIFDRNTLGSPSGVTVRDLESPNSPYVALGQNEARTVRGAKQIMQQLDRMEELVPQVLPKSRIGIPITLAESTFGEKASGKAAELDRISSFEQLKGIRDFLAAGRINQAEIHNVGRINRFTDSQTTAQAKIKAMRDLVSGTIGAMDLNHDALTRGPRAPESTGVSSLHVPDQYSNEVQTLISGMIDQGKSKEEIRAAVQRYLSAHPGLGDADIR